MSSELMADGAEVSVAVMVEPDGFVYPLLDVNGARYDLDYSDVRRGDPGEVGPLVAGQRRGVVRKSANGLTLAMDEGTFDLVQAGCD